MCGPSEKDAGHKIGSIMKIEYPNLYHQIIDKLLENDKNHGKTSVFLQKKKNWNHFMR